MVSAHWLSLLSCTLLVTHKWNYRGREMVPTAVSDLPGNAWLCEYSTEDGLRKSNIESGCISNTRQILLGQEEIWKVVFLFLILYISDKCSFISARSGMTVQSERTLDQSSSSLFPLETCVKAHFAALNSDPFYNHKPSYSWHL